MRKRRADADALDKKRIAPLKTPQSIIHIKHRISLRQYKYWVLLLQELRQHFDRNVQPDEKGFYAMRMEKLTELMGYAPVKSEVWDDLLALKNETIAFNVLNKDGENEKYGAGFISEWRVTNSFVRFKFPSFLEDVMRWLEGPKAMFSLINWDVFNHFSGKYEAIIYKLCKDYIGVGRTPHMRLEQFREYMGIKPHEYPEFKKLNACVISGPVYRINASEVSDIVVHPEFAHEWRKTVGLFFNVEHKKQTSLPLHPIEEESAFRFAKLPIAPWKQAKYLAMRSPADIQLCIERANEYGEQQEKLGKPVNYGGLYHQAIVEGWHGQYAAVKEQAAIKQDRVESARVEAAQNAALKTEQRARAAAEKARAWVRFENLPEDERHLIESEYLRQAPDPERAIFGKRRFDSPAFRIFLRKRVLDSE